MRRILISVLSAILVFSASFSAYAQGQKVSEKEVEYIFKTTNPDYKKYTVAEVGKDDLKMIPDKIDGGFFTFKRITDIKVKLNGEDKETRVEKEFKGLTEKKIPDETIEKDGKELKLLPDETIWTSVERTLATGTMTIRGVDKEPTFPDTKEISITVNGSVKKVQGKRYDVKKSSGYTKDVTINAKFLGDEDAEEYTLYGAVIPVNPAYPEYKGYEKIILKAYGRDPDKHIITGSKWTSDYIYVPGDDTYMRKAAFYAKRYSTDYTAYYREEIAANEDLVISYDAKAIYSDGKETVYDVTVTALYGKTEIRVDRVAYVSFAVIAIMVGLIVLILKRKKKPNNVEGKGA